VSAAKAEIARRESIRDESNMVICIAYWVKCCHRLGEVLLGEGMLLLEEDGLTAYYNPETMCDFILQDLSAADAELNEYS